MGGHPFYERLNWILEAADPDAKVAKMKNGSTCMARKVEHAVDMETGAMVDHSQDAEVRIQ